MTNFFEIFSLPQKFFIDSSELEKKYLEFQKQFHPDKSSVNEIEKSILINEAYKILSDDFLRACYLLSLKGVDIRNDEKALKVDFVTLESILELQEKIAENSDKNEIKDLHEKLNTDIKLLIATAIKSLEDNHINLSAQSLVKAKYLKKSLEGLKIRKQEI